MSAELSPRITIEDLRAEVRAIIDRLPPEALAPVAEFLRSFEIRPEQSEAETLNRFFATLSAELRAATESVRTAREGLNELTSQFSKCNNHSNH